jgi:hypothetical protein
VLRPASVCAVHRRMLIGHSSMSAFFLPAPASCQRRTSAQPAAVPRYSATRPAGSVCGRRRARASALRRWARSKHARLGCRYAPLPGSREVRSGTISPPATTTRINSGLAARTPQPTHVRMGDTGRAGCSRRCGCAVPTRAVPFWAGLVRLALVFFSLPCRPRVRPPPRFPCGQPRCDGSSCGTGLDGRHQAASGAPDPSTPSPSGTTSSGAADAAAGPELAVSGLISIRQPVSLAARRAFCPSLPIASDS